MTCVWSWIQFPAFIMFIRMWSAVKMAPSTDILNQENLILIILLLVLRRRRLCHRQPRRLYCEHYIWQTATPGWILQLGLHARSEARESGNVFAKCRMYLDRFDIITWQSPLPWLPISSLIYLSTMMTTRSDPSSRPIGLLLLPGYD